MESVRDEKGTIAFIHTGFQVPSRLRAVLVSEEVLAFLFSPHGLVCCAQGLPEGARFVGMTPALYDGDRAFLFAHPDWELLAPHAPVPVVAVTYEALAEDVEETQPWTEE